MTISASGTYDVTIEMRDTTGTVIADASQCGDYADPSLVGAPSGTSVTSTVLGSADDPDGLGCRVTISGVQVPDASATATASSGSSSTSTPLVVRDGDTYVVTLPDLSGVTGTESGTVSGTDSGDASDSSTAAADTSTAASDSATATSADDTALTSMVDARVSVTFPGAVIDSDGGTVSGRTVAWADADALAGGVTATGYASPEQGITFWDRHSWWVIGAVIAAGAALGTGAVLRRRVLRH